MKKGKILTAVGAVLAVIGVYLAVMSALPEEQTFQDTLPADTQYYNYYMIEFGGLIGGSVEVDLTVADGAMDVYVFDSDQFAEYETSLEADHLYTTSGDSGSFTWDVPDSGTYYVVMDHSPADTSSDQDFTVTMTVNGISIMGMVIGIVLIAVGVVIAVFGLRMQKKEAVATPAPPQTGVTFFQGEQGPPGKV